MMTILRCFYFNQPQFTLIQVFVERFTHIYREIYFYLRDTIINIAACLTSEYKPLTVRD